MNQHEAYSIVSIDPGIRGTGLCVWNSSTWGQIVSKTNRQINIRNLPIHVENFNPRAGDNWMWTSERYHEKFHELVQRFTIRKVFCEFPQFFASEIGLAATGKGDIHKLACLVGVFAGATWEYGGQFTPILVNDWKGQLPKAAVERRICDRLPTITDCFDPQSHSWDAIGIGLYAQGERFGQ